MSQLRRLVVTVLAVAALAACGEQSAGAPPPPDTAVSAVGSATSGPQLATVVGVVRDRAGRPVSGALVLPTGRDAGTPPVPEIAVTTDAAGRYAWTLRPGRYALVARHGERASTAVPVEVPATGRRTVDLVLPG